MKANNLILAGIVLFAAFATAKAQDYSILVSDSVYTQAQPAGTYNSTLSGTTVENFNELSVGDHYGASFNGVGTINEVSVINNNLYGGAPDPSGQGRYAVQTAGANEVKPAAAIPVTTITLNTPSSYFGMYWSAGDPNNTINFYNGTTLVGSFTSQNLMDKLPSGYYGNPNPDFLHQDSHEPFGFVNFSAGAGTSWTSIQLIDNAGSGFESDNWTTRVDAWNPTTDGTLPGTPVSIITTTPGATNSTSTLVSSVTVTNGHVVITPDSGSSISFSPAVASGAAPGAPAPPLTACLAFAGVLILQAFRSRRTA